MQARLIHPYVDTMDEVLRLDRVCQVRISGRALKRLKDAQFQQPDGNAGDSANFGRIFAARSPRLIQFSAKLIW
jgi:hypothetical protein